MPVLGRIVRLQVQESSLKVGGGPRRWYDPSPILSVPRLRLTADGVVAVLEDDVEIVDVHNRKHPDSKNRGENGVSIGFISHYDAMRYRFGDHIVDGIAGENILVEIDRMVDAEEVAKGLVIETSGGERIELSDVIVAAPCVEFSRFALRFPRDARPDRSVTEAVQFLHEGMRGFYARYEGPAAILSVGDELQLA